MGRRFAVATLSITAALAISQPAEAASSYCSPTGDYCVAVDKRAGAWRIKLFTFSFRGRVKTCVTGPSGSRKCRRFKLRKQKGGSLYGFTRRWSSYYPNEGQGQYRVRYFKDGVQIGKTLTFKR